MRRFSLARFSTFSLSIFAQRGSARIHHTHACESREPG